MNSQAGDRQNQGGPVKDKDNIRASILDEAIIVCLFDLLSIAKKSPLSQLDLLL